MGILGINNRTENWKTVQHFHGLSDAAKVGLARRLGEPDDTAAEEIQLELFWCGMRDFAFHREDGVETDELVRLYEHCFGELRDEIGKTKLQLNDVRNYTVGDGERLADNVKNTEVDIVLETRDRIFIGEAKYESGLGADGSLVLVHQLIRQYVTTKILVHLAGRKKHIVPFVVTESGKKRDSMMKTGQVEFMIKKGWLRECNVLTWGDVNDIRIGCR